MNKNIKIAFFGTSDRSIPILDSLKSSFDLALCVTKEDTKFGRHQVLKETKVKFWAKENNINYLTINDLKEDNTQTVVKKLKELKVDIGIVADFSLIIPKDIINATKHKLINIHFSLLPKYRGASPIQFAILNGDEKTGVTYYVMDKNMDTGNILNQIEYKLTDTETSGQLYANLFLIAAQNLPKIITQYIDGALNPLLQDKSKATYTYSKTHPKSTFIYKEDAKINWQSGSIYEIERQIRAYNPWPIAWTILSELENNEKIGIIHLKQENKQLNNLKVKIFEAKIIDGKFKNQLKKVLRIEKIQVEGKKVLTWKQFANGYMD